MTDPNTTSQAKEQRLAAALRDNLLKRKQQLRERKSDEPSSNTDQPQEQG